ncbi:MAG: hypothetical protein WB421_02880 [Terriglobales bacterium]|jgi:hypothetical protein
MSPQDQQAEEVLSFPSTESSFFAVEIIALDTFTTAAHRLAAMEGGAVVDS